MDFLDTLSLAISDRRLTGEACMRRVKNNAKTMLSKRGFTSVFFFGDGDDVLVGKGNENRAKADITVHFCKAPKATTKCVRDIVEDESFDFSKKKIIVTLFGSTTTKNEKFFSESVQHLTYFFLLNDVTEHVLVPRHELVSKEEEADAICKKYASAAKNLDFPILLKTDPVSQFFGFEKGDLVRIHRKSYGGLAESVCFFRRVS